MCCSPNEPSIFGLPTVLNVYTYIPMLICGILNYTVYHLLASAGILGRFFVTLPFTVPSPLYAFLATMDPKTVILYIVLFVADFFILAPFITTYDKQILKAESESEAQ